MSSEQVVKLRLPFENFVYSLKDKRTHPPAEFEKFYSVWAYYDTKYNDLCKMISQRNYSKLNRYPDITKEVLDSLTLFDTDKIKNLCWVLDDDGQKVHLGDKKHIYRTKTLKNLRALLVEFLDFEIMMSFAQIGENEIIKDFGDFVYYEERYTTEFYLYQGVRYKGQQFSTKDIELKWVVDSDTKTQIQEYIKVLRFCRSGLTLQEAVKKAKEEYLYGRLYKSAN